MLSGARMALPAAAITEARAYLRIDGGSEDAAIAGLGASAAELCESFTGQALLAREFSETLTPTGAWQRLGATPVRGVIAVEAGANGWAPLPVGDYAVDIDEGGDGWARVRGGAQVRVRFRAGLAETWEDLPAALRHGIVRLTAHLYAARDQAEGPPAAVTALWRPYRRMRLR